MFFLSQLLSWCGGRIVSVRHCQASDVRCFGKTSERASFLFLFFFAFSFSCVRFIYSGSFSFFFFSFFSFLRGQVRERGAVAGRAA